MHPEDTDLTSGEKAAPPQRSAPMKAQEIHSTTRFAPETRDEVEVSAVIPMLVRNADGSTSVSREDSVEVTVRVLGSGELAEHASAALGTILARVASHVGGDPASTHA